MKNRVLLPAISVLVCCGVFSASHAISPKTKNNPATDKTATDSLPDTQEATEESVLPEEPTLSSPTPAADPTLPGLPVQPLPSGDILQPSGPTVDERRKSAEAFRSAKTEAEEQFSIADIKARAFAASTEREKRVLLREYYRAVSAYVIKRSAALKDVSEVWAYQQLMRLDRSRTEPGNKPPVPPAAMVAAQARAAANPSNKANQSATPNTGQPAPGATNGLLPTFGN